MNKKDIKAVDLVELLKPKVIEYGIYVAEDRAFPDVADGLKPVHRRIVWSLNEAGLKYNKYRQKSAKAVGFGMSYSPHGDSSLYEAMVRLTNDSVNYNLLDGKGAFSSVMSDDQAGASRYTETRLSKFTNDVLLMDTKKHNIETTLTYDEKNYEPIKLPSKVPLVLMNVSIGIGYGMSTTIPSFDLIDLFETTKSILKNEQPELIYPTFATGGILIKDPIQAEKLMNEGKGSSKIRATWEETKDGDIIITGLPYGVKIESVIKRVEDLSGMNDGTSKNSKSKTTPKDKLIIEKNISDIHDSSSKDGYTLTIERTKNKNKMTNQELMMYLYKKTPLQSSIGANMNVLNGGLPELLGVKGILLAWIKERVKFLVRVSENKLNDLKYELSLIEGYKTIYDDIDEVINLIKESKSRTKAKPVLMKEYGLSDIQVDSILNISLGNINKEYLDNKIKEGKKIESQISKEEKFVNSKSLQAKKLLFDFQEVIDEFYIPRKTQLTDSFEEYEDDNSIEDYNVKIVITKEGYIKKIPLTSLRGNSEMKLKTDDEIVSELETTNSEEILVYTNQRNIYKIYNLDLPNNKPSDLGVFLESHLVLLKNEAILGVLALSKDTKWILMGYEDGKVAKVEVMAFRTKTKRGLIKNGYPNKTPILLRTLEEDIDLMASTSENKCVVMNTEKINPKASRTTQGSAFIKPRKEHTVVKYDFDLESKLDDVEYYRLANAGTGKFIKGE